MEKVNTENLEKRHIKKSFDVCGVNLWYNELRHFEDHIASLSEKKIYKDLLNNNNNNNDNNNNDIH